MSTALAIWNLLTPGQRRSALVLLGLMLVGMLLEMLSIGLILPTLSLVAGGSRTALSPPGRWLGWLGDPASPRFLLVSLLVLAGVFAVKSMFLLFVTYRQTQFAAAVQASLSRRLFALYLAQPWTFHLQRNSADLIRTINDAQGYAQICTVVLMALTECLVMAGLGALLFCVEPTGSLVVAAVLGAAAWAFHRLARRRSRQLGWKRRHHATMLLQHLQQGLGGAKDVTILGRTHWFLERFHLETEGLAKVAARQSLIDQSPRQWFEPLAILALVLLAVVMVWQGRPTESIVPMLGLFATVAFRLLPTVNRFSMWLQTLHFNDAMIRGLAEEVALEVSPPAPESAARISLGDAITLERVDYVYPGVSGPALRDVSLRIPQGASVGLVGGSGSGKSTLVDVMLGLLPPTSGRVCVDGVDIRDNLRAWQNLVGYVAQSIFLTDDTIRRNVAFGVPDEMIEDAAVRRALKAARLDEFVDGLPAGVETVVGERGVRLSGGQRQRIGIARALYHDPQVLVLDEATSALDVETEQEVMAAVNSLHGAKTLVIVAHRLSTVAGCDLLYRLDEGRVDRSGTFAEVTVP